jgi:Ca2+-binding EF-hand superfamily protein
MNKSRLTVLTSTMTLGLASVLILAGCGGTTDDPASPASSQAMTSAQGAGPVGASPGRGPAGLMARFDANKNGKLETSELPPRARQRLGSADTNADGVITEQELQAGMAKHQAQRFAQADSNGDGQLTESEVGEFRWNHMKAADANGDGKLSLEEFRAAHAQGKLGPPRGRGQGARGGPGGWAHAGQGKPGGWAGAGQGKPGERPFQRFDANGDGKLDKTEVPDFVWERIGVADANGDGAVTKDEIQAAHQNGTLKPPPGRGGRRGPRGPGQAPGADPGPDDAAQ